MNGLRLPAPVAILPKDFGATSGMCQRALHLLRAEFEPAVAVELGISAAAIRKSKSRILHRLRMELGDLFE